MVLLAIVATLVIFGIITQRYGSRRFQQLGAVSLIGHIFVGTVVVPRLPYKWDIQKFHVAATTLLNGDVPSWASSVNSFAAFQAFVYALFGADPVVLSVINGLLAVLIPLPLCYLARELYPSLESTDGLVAVVLFLPLPFLFFSVPMRDTLSAFCLILVSALLVNAIVEYGSRSMVLAVPLWGMLFLLRSELALPVLLGGFGAVGVQVLHRFGGEDISLNVLSATVAVVGLVGFALFGTRFPLDRVNAKLQYRAIGSASYLDFVQYENWIDLLTAVPIRAIYFQFAPFPLHANSPFDFLAVAWLPALIAIAVSAYYSLKHSRTNTATAVFLVLLYFGGVTGYGLIDSNFGTTTRHRIPFVLLLCLFATPVLEQQWNLLLRWVDGEPHHSSDDGEQQHKTEELDAGVEV